MPATASRRPPPAGPAHPSWISPLAFPKLHGRKLAVQLAAGSRLGGLGRTALLELALRLRPHPDLEVCVAGERGSSGGCDVLHQFGVDPRFLWRGRSGERRLCTVALRDAGSGAAVGLRRLGGWAEEALARLLCHGADAVIAASPLTAARLRSAGVRAPLRTHVGPLTVAEGSDGAALSALVQLYDLAACGKLAPPPPAAPGPFRLLEWPL